MTLSQAFEFIMNSIPKGFYFDSHFIIQNLIEEYSDDYLLFCSQYVNSNEATRTAHAQIGKEIQKLCMTGLISQIGDSISYNLHHKKSKSTIYQKN
jgi:hypothetical protein